MEEKTITIIKIISNLILIILLVLTLYKTIYYGRVVREAIGLKSPTLLLDTYENITSTKCLCGNPYMGEVIYVPFKNLTSQLAFSPLK